jgi:signal transduction histidine kinase/DNA-binding response OmpR family regulator
MRVRDAAKDSRFITIGIMVLFVIGLVWAASNVRRSDILLNDRLSENMQWAGWQVPFELGRLANAILSYRVEPTVAARENVRLRLDIAVSRLQILKSGSIASEIEAFGLSEDAQRLVTDFEMVDRNLQHILDAEESGINLLEQWVKELEGVISFSQQFAAQIQTAEGARIVSLVDSKSARLHELYFILTGLMLAGLFFSIVIFTGARRVQRLGEAALTERERAELSEQILMEAIEALPDAFALYDDQDRLILFNRRYREFYHSSADLLVVGHTFEEIIRRGVERGQYLDAQADPEAWIAKRLAAHNNPGSQLEQRLDDGRFLRVTELRTSAGYIVGIRTDVTEFKKAQQRAEHSEQRFRLAAQMTTDGLWELSLETDELWVSNQFREIFALGDQPPSLELWKSRMTEVSWRLTLLAILDCAQGRTETFEVQQILETDEGAQRYISCRGVREATEDSGAVRIVGAIVDETERRLFEKKINDARLAAERIAEARDSFMTMISHEIRTPMTGVIGALEAIAEEELSPDARRYTAIALESGQALRAVIDDVLDAAKIEAGEFDLRSNPFSPGDLVIQVARLMTMRASRVGLDLAVFVDPRVPRSIISDELRLRQVLVNLLGNAIKFTPRGGVALRLERQDGDGETCRLRFAVIDTGIGIAADKLDRLFTPFRQIDEGYRREFGGTGLGLSISQSIVKALGGQIVCTSQPGQGSTFAFEMVCKIDGEAAACFPCDALSGWEVDLVSTSPTIRTTLGDQLEALGAAPLRRLEPTADGETQRIDLRLVDCNQRGPGADAAPEEKVVRLREDDLAPPYDPQTLLFLLANTALEDLGAQPTPGETVPFKGLRALIAEDSPVNRELCERMMIRQGFEVVSVSNGATAVEAARAGDFDVILMDVSMPVMDGIEATQQIRAFCEVPIIAVTAHAFASANRKVRDAGMNYHLVKPFRSAALHDALEAVLGKRQTAAPETLQTEPAAPSLADRRLVEPAVIVQLETDIGTEMALELLNSYKTEMISRVERITAAIDASDTATVEHEAHALKSSSKAFGALAMGHLAQEIETRARRADTAFGDLRANLTLLAGQTENAIAETVAARTDVGADI